MFFVKGGRFFRELFFGHRRREHTPKKKTPLVGAAFTFSEEKCSDQAIALMRALRRDTRRDAAFLVMPSRDEGFGFVYLEAMRAGRPCIACPGAAAEILEDGRSGVLVTFGSVAELEGACVRLLSDPNLCSQLGRAGAEAVRERFLTGHFVDRFRQALRLRQCATNLPGSPRGPEGSAPRGDASAPHDGASSVPGTWA